tara:strand:+ start:4145 stop:4894 length:750 start_codon:yes stop_codon:yes gene_type:complete
MFIFRNDLITIFMRKLFILFFILIWNCNDGFEKISISKVEGSPSFNEAKLSLSDSIFKNEEGYSFSFNVDEYNLGDQTLKNFNYELANSEKGQHIHLIINNGPYFAKYTTDFTQKLQEGNNVILAFLSRSYHESVKNPNAYFFTQIGNNEKIDLNNEFLFYSRPKGTYEGEATKKLLLDFYLINTQISPKGNKVRLTIDNKEFLIDEWVPYYIEGLKKGEISIKLELINSNGELIKSPFNPSIRKIILK